ncbi:MAG: hypothetical protein C0404_14305 [Verrucomicrobia bacterium]|nr:hypothetical protein [Verrucomicrobiota bacterium]
MVTLIPAAYTGGGGSSYVVEIVTNAAHASVAVTNGTTFRYSPAVNYSGSDRFYWRMKYGPNTSSMTSYTAIACCSLMVKALSTDWPQWRCDEFRSGITALDLPSQLHLQWRRDFRALTSAWNGFYMKFDGYYQPVAMGQQVFIAASGTGGNDSLVALSTVDGTESWRFYANAPIRLAPVAVNGRVYVSSDDGHLYCLNAADGSLAWKFRGGPSDRKIFGNERMISAWPGRGGVLHMSGKLYFTAGLWPQEGTFIYCLDAATGAIVWKNDSASGLTANMQHDNATQVPAGLSPQGYPVMGADGWSLQLAVCRANPAILSRSTGAISQYVQGNGGYYGTIYSGGGWWINSSGVPSYSAPAVQVTSGSRTWTATDASALGVSGSPSGMIAADNKLFVVTSSGSVYCFGGTSTATPPVYPVTTTPFPDLNDSWKTLATQILSTTSNREGCCFVAGLGTGRLAEELLKQTTLLHVIAIDPNAAKVATFRAKMDAAGLYGTRCSALIGNPLDAGLPPYAGRLIVSEDLAAAGFTRGQTFVQAIFRTIRPYGGTMWLITSESEHSSLTAWVAGAGLSNAVLSRVEGAYSRLDRIGALPGATNCEGASGSSNDLLVKAPLGMQWFGDKYTWGVGHGDNTRPDVINGKMRCPAITQDIYTGLPLSLEARTGGSGWGSNDFGVRKNPFYNVDEGRGVYSGYGCGAGMNSYGKLATARSGAAAFYDLHADMGTVHLTAVRPGCGGSASIAPANGVLLVGGGGCGCNYPLTPSAMALVHLPEVENWGMYSSERSGRSVESEPVHRIGVNFGAPGERKDNDGTMWIHRPQRQSSSPPFGINYSGTNVGWYYHNASRIQDGTDKPWIAASGIKGVTNVSIGLTPESVVAATCAQPPVLDGYLTDSCWDGRYPVFMLGGNSQVFVRKDASNLYIACRRTAANPVNWVEFADAKAFWRVLLSDSDHGWTRYVNLSITGDGVRTDSIKNTNDWWTAEDTAWEGSWTCGWRGGTYSTEFIVEFCIPWTMLTDIGINTNKLVFDVCGKGYYGQAGTLFRKYWSGGNHDRWAPVGFDAPYGKQAFSRDHTVKLYFAETEGATAGQRVFDVKIQGQTVLTDFDIAQQAGGADKAVIRVFNGIAGLDRMTVDLVPKTGVPIISAIELIEATNASPAVVSALAAGAEIGKPFSYVIQAAGSAPITFSASGLPSGLTFNGTNTISGTPNTAGTNNITITATNPFGTDTKTLVLTVAPGVDAYGIPNSWKIQHFGSTTGPNTGALDDFDHDGMNNYAEWKAGTDPDSAGSRLQCSVFDVQGAMQPDGNLVVQWSSVAGKLYTLKRATNLLNGFNEVLTNHVVATAPMNVYTVRTDQAGQRFYTVAVE